MYICRVCRVGRCCEAVTVDRHIQVARITTNSPAYVNRQASFLPLNEAWLLLSYKDPLQSKTHNAWKRVRRKSSRAADIITLCSISPVPLPVPGPTLGVGIETAFRYSWIKNMMSGAMLEIAMPCGASRSRFKSGERLWVAQRA
jgi:hypothetical protein